MGIAMRAGVADIRVGFLTELGRIDVVAAAEQEAIESFEDLWTGIGRIPRGSASRCGPGVVAVEDVVSTVRSTSSTSIVSRPVSARP